jgi:PHO85 cyclin-6/7
VTLEGEDEGNEKDKRESDGVMEVDHPVNGVSESSITRANKVKDQTPPPPPASTSTLIPISEPRPTTSSTQSNSSLPASHPTVSDTSFVPNSSPSPPKAKKQHVDLSTFPSSELLKLLAKLLGQITAANDQLPPVQDRMKVIEEERERKRRERRGTNEINVNQDPHRLPSSTSFTEVNQPPIKTPSSSQKQSRPLLPTTPTSTSIPLPPSTRNPLSASTEALKSTQSHLCFHARNVPNISIENYLVRILKYCPTTNEVFLSLLVYFDRMARLGEDEEEVERVEGTGEVIGGGGEGRVPFAIDSFNVHRLIIAGVTVASKFFSDVFYTNSRYAKVSRSHYIFQEIVFDERVFPFWLK